MTAYGRFKDRSEAGRALARVLVDRALPDPVVLALPRGGVPVAAEVARALQAPLDLVLVRKIGVEYQPELAVAAVVDGEHPEIVVNENVRAIARVSQGYIDEQAIDELAEIERRRHVYLQGRPRAPIEGRSVIIVDDGIARRAAFTEARRHWLCRFPNEVEQPAQVHGQTPGLHVGQPTVADYWSQDGTGCITGFDCDDGAPEWESPGR